MGLRFLKNYKNHTRGGGGVEEGDGGRGFLVKFRGLVVYIGGLPIERGVQVLPCVSNERIL